MAAESGKGRMDSPWPLENTAPDKAQNVFAEAADRGGGVEPTDAPADPSAGIDAVLHSAGCGIEDALPCGSAKRGVE